MLHPLGPWDHLVSPQAAQLWGLISVVPGVPGLIVPGNPRDPRHIEAPGVSRDHRNVNIPGILGVPWDHRDVNVPGVPVITADPPRDHRHEGI